MRPAAAGVTARRESGVTWRDPAGGGGHGARWGLLSAYKISAFPEADLADLGEMPRHEKTGGG